MSSEIDLAGLQMELVQALNAEKKYQRENDAKFRAVHQKVATYEEFRDIVKASHLQPLERRDIVGSSRNQPWNSLYTSSTTDNKTNPILITDPSVPPTTGQELLRKWRSLKGEQLKQYQLMLSLPIDAHAGTLKTEASISLFGEILIVLCKFFNSSDVEIVSAILLTLAKTPRFKLSLSLLSNSEKESVKILVEQVFSASSDTQQLEELKQLYTMT